MGIFETIDQLIRLGPEFALKFLVAVLCGGAIGMERETTGKPAGLRTSILICLGSMLFTVMSIELGKLNNGDGSRIAAQIVSGVGFLGAGVIFRDRTQAVKGVTTAAMIWVMAALGMMIGSGYLLSSLAVTLCTVMMILVLRRVEERIHRRQARRYRFMADDVRAIRERITGAMGEHDGCIRQFAIRPGEGGTIIVDFLFMGPNDERRDLLRGLYQIEGLFRVENEEQKRGIIDGLMQGLRKRGSHDGENTR